jgi:predicted RNA-binding protein with PUA-like domain
MEIVGEAAQDSTDDTGKWIAVTVAPVEPLKRPVTLKIIKADPHLCDMAIVRQSRLSVAPVSAEEYAYIVKLSQKA